MGAQRMPVDPDVGIPDLVRRLGDDSKRLVTDEVRLAKLEMQDNVQRGGHGVLWLAVAFGIGVVAMVAFTLFFATLIGRMASGHMWVGAIVTGLIELGAAAFLIKRGLGAFTEPSYSLEQTRASLKSVTSS
jgi:ABC-type polysaccharide/polyol phosphate export permease